MIIGFHGRLGSGKDTAGERLAQLVAVPTKRISFAEKLKTSAAEALDVTVDWLEDNKNNDGARIIVVDGYQYVDGSDVTEANVMSELTVRQYLQRYGTEAHRQVFGDSFWVEQALGGYPGAETLRMADITYVTDVRFENELIGIQDRAGVVIRVLDGKEPELHHWKGIDKWYEYAPDGTKREVHISEVPLQNCDYEIDNTVRNDNFANLDRQLRRILKDLRIKLK